MKQDSLFGTSPDGTPATDPLDGFEAWWRLYPRDIKRRNRKCGKGKCRAYWVKNKLAKEKDRIMAALREDIAGIEKGAFSFSPGSDDLMFSFPMTTTWINPNSVKGARWDRDVEPEAKPRPQPKPPQPPPKPLTDEDRRRAREIMEQARINSRMRADVIDPNGTVVGRAGVREAL
jgi:hypothetical protein